MSDRPVSEEKKSKIPSLPDFCLKVPLYEKIPIRKDEDEVEDDPWKVRLLAISAETLDAYCQECRKISVFNSENVPGKYRPSLKYAIFSREFFYSRDTGHSRLIFIFEVRKEIIRKIGQFPSTADLASPELQKYRSVLPAEYFKEFSRAIGLVSHGVGIGSYAYLRRIFERLIEEAHDRAKTPTGWNDEEYMRSRMEERILLLKDYLPDFLVENRSIYSILSKALHELTEEECLESFPVVKLGIEMILDKTIERNTKEKKVKIAARAIAELRKKMTPQRERTPEP